MAEEKTFTYECGIVFTHRLYKCRVYLGVFACGEEKFLIEFRGGAKAYLAEYRAGDIYYAASKYSAAESIRIMEDHEKWAFSDKIVVEPPNFEDVIGKISMPARTRSRLQPVATV